RVGERCSVIAGIVVPSRWPRGWPRAVAAKATKTHRYPGGRGVVSASQQRRCGGGDRPGGRDKNAIGRIARIEVRQQPRFYTSGRDWGGRIQIQGTRPRWVVGFRGGRRAHRDLLSSPDARE